MESKLSHISQARSSVIVKSLANLNGSVSPDEGLSLNDHVPDSASDYPRLQHGSFLGFAAAPQDLFGSTRLVKRHRGGYDTEAFGQENEQRLRERRREEHPEQRNHDGSREPYHKESNDGGISYNHPGSIRPLVFGRGEGGGGYPRPSILHHGRQVVSMPEEGYKSKNPDQEVSQKKSGCICKGSQSQTAEKFNEPPSPFPTTPEMSVHQPGQPLSRYKQYAEESSKSGPFIRGFSNQQHEGKMPPHRYDDDTFMFQRPGLHDPIPIQEKFFQQMRKDEGRRFQGHLPNYPQKDFPSYAAANQEKIPEKCLNKNASYFYSPPAEDRTPCCGGKTCCQMPKALNHEQQLWQNFNRQQRRMVPAFMQETHPMYQMLMNPSLPELYLRMAKGGKIPFNLAGLPLDKFGYGCPSMNNFFGNMSGPMDMMPPYPQFPVGSMEKGYSDQQTYRLPGSPCKCNSRECGSSPKTCWMESCADRHRDASPDPQDTQSSTDEPVHSENRNKICKRKLDTERDIQSQPDVNDAPLAKRSPRNCESIRRDWPAGDDDVPPTHGDSVAGTSTGGGGGELADCAISSSDANRAQDSDEERSSQMPNKPPENDMSDMGGLSPLYSANLINEYEDFPGIDFSSLTAGNCGSPREELCQPREETEGTDFTQAQPSVIQRCRNKRPDNQERQLWDLKTDAGSYASGSEKHGYVDAWAVSDIKPGTPVSATINDDNSYEYMEIKREPEEISYQSPAITDTRGELSGKLDVHPSGSVVKRRRRKKHEAETDEDRRPTSDCNVCGDKAIAHMHYGGICCYSCKAFFRRAVQSKKDLKYRCKIDNDCDVMMSTRRGCQKCRFEKCKAIGMVPSWVLSDEQCEKRFGKSKLKRKGGYPNIKREEEEKPKPALSPAISKINVKFSDNMTDSDELSIEYMSCVYEASKELIAFSEENNHLWSKLFAEESKAKHTYSSQDMTGLIQTVIKKNIFFLEANSYFKKLDFDDKKKLLRKNMFEMGQLRGALRFDNRDKKFLWYFNQKDKPNMTEKCSTENKKIDQGDLGKFYSSDTAAKGIIKVMERIASVGLSSEGILILMHVVVFNGDGLELNKKEFVEQVQLNYFGLLERYLFTNLGKEARINMISKVISLLADLRQLSDKTEDSKLNNVTT